MRKVLINRYVYTFILFLSILILSTFTTGFFYTNLSANAEPPWTYTSGGKLFSKTTECVSEGKQIIRASGFKVNEVVYDADNWRVFF